MKKIVLLLCCITALHSINAQESLLQFDKKYYECENKWVALPLTEKDTAYMIGVVYLDEQAGFTFGYEGKMTITDKYRSHIESPRTNRMIYRIPEEYTQMAIIPDAKVQEMNLPTEPDWLPIYRKGEDEVQSQVKRGFHFNHIGGSLQAIPILLKAYAKEPHAEGLEFELAYAYNAIEQPAKAIEVLEKAIKNDPKNYMFYRELGYSYILADKFGDAEKTYKKGIAMSDNAYQQAEMAFNMAGAYYRLKDKKKFDEWVAITRKYAKEDTIYFKNLLLLESKFDK
ncbi:hypothetical protein AAEO56_00160 [Flavobacterium sp. DGU11]|uniref:Tetratricopeptide repeat-containing protein n=1 Tax=Flavobacterium arundinis TaxID=3139143 RepID=A0ABU9HR77_9FLAO